MKKLYRYRDFQAEDGVTLMLQEFTVIRETDKTYFFKKQMWGRKVNYVRKGASRSFAYDTKDAAFNSYIERKKKQLWHAKVAMQTAELALAKAGECKGKLKRDRYDFCDNALMGKPEFYENIFFD